LKTLLSLASILIAAPAFAQQYTQAQCTAEVNSAIQCQAAPTVLAPAVQSDMVYESDQYSIANNNYQTKKSKMLMIDMQAVSAYLNAAWSYGLSASTEYGNGVTALGAGNDYLAVASNDQTLQNWTQGYLNAQSAIDEYNQAYTVLTQSAVDWASMATEIAAANKILAKY
jgi:hypothetical protein